MTTVLKMMYKFYHDSMVHYADPRTEDFFLSRNIFIPAALVLVYLQFVLKWGPQFMKNRPAFNMNKILIAYNLLQIFLSIRMFYLAIIHTYILGDYKFQCEPVDYSTSDMAMMVAHEIHNYYLLKVLDLLDTVFFVLRKKQRQITFLHLYHHVGMVMASWFGVRFVPGGHVVFIGFLNSFVHSVMYSYYLLAIFNNAALVWWKKYLTILQIIQFGVIATQWAVMLLGPSCGFPKYVGYILLPQNIFMTLMFIEFYYKTYIKNK